MLRVLRAPRSGIPIVTHILEIMTFSQNLASVITGQDHSFRWACSEESGVGLTGILGSNLY